MTGPHPLAAWVQGTVADQADRPRRTPGERFPELEEDDLDQRRRRARSSSRARRSRATVSRVRYS